MNHLNKKYYTETLGLPTSLLDLPERVLQFGTGVLLRGLPNYLMDKANKQGVFNGRAVVVKSTSSDTSDFDTQDCLYTLHERGVYDDGEASENQILITALSRVVNANTEWKEVLKCAENPAMQIVISNTTEVGLQYVEEDIFQSPPKSFPAKLTAFLYKRFQFFKGTEASGMTVIPTELLVNNGTLLRGYVLQHAENNDLSQDFKNWLNMDCDFCDSLVDRIVPGALSAKDRQKMAFEDNLAIQAEPFLLWAVEGNSRVQDRLSFAQTDSRLVITEDITPFREQKLRVLNGGHTISVPLAFLAGEKLVVDMMSHPLLGRFVERVILDEIVPMLDGICDNVEAFAQAVINRFKNPFIAHKLLSITVQCSSKMQSRNALTFQRYYEKHDKMPPLMSMGFAAYLLFSRPVKMENGQYFGENLRTKESYPIHDDKAAILQEHWADVDDFSRPQLENLVKNIVADDRLFEDTLKNLPYFTSSVAFFLHEIVENGVLETLEKTAALQAVSV
jgi:tagaturonate reductase